MATGTKKVKVLADAMRVWHFDEDHMVIKKRGYRDYKRGDVVELPDWVADDALRQGTPTPTGGWRPVAVLADDDDDSVTDLAPGVSPHPEADFGSTNVGGELIADPKGDLAGQRMEARKAELNPSQAKQANKPQGQQSAPQQSKEAK